MNATRDARIRAGMIGAIRSKARRNLTLRLWLAIRASMLVYVKLLVFVYWLQGNNLGCKGGFREIGLLPDTLDAFGNCDIYSDGIICCQICRLSVWKVDCYLFPVSVDLCGHGFKRGRWCYRVALSAIFSLISPFFESMSIQSVKAHRVSVQYIFPFPE